MNKILAMREKRGEVWDKAKAFLNEHQDENGMLSPEDAAQYERMEQEVVDLGHAIEREERAAQMDRELNAPTMAPLASRPEAEADLLCDVVGRCCESDDVIQPDVRLPEPERGEILAVCTTGAYNYSMASNYNRLARPAMVMLTEDSDYLAVRRETLDDLVRNDI